MIVLVMAARLVLPLLSSMILFLRIAALPSLYSPYLLDTLPPFLLLQPHDFAYGYPVLTMKTEMDVNFKDTRRTVCVEKCHVSIAG